MKASVIAVTPAKATAFLKKNKNIRNMNLRKVEGMVRDMKADLWEENGESIKFQTVRGKEWLKDGQNRLQAIVDSGKTQNMVVVTGIKGDRNIDVGEKRSLTHYLKHEGVLYAVEKSAAVGNILSITYHMEHPEVHTRRPSTQEDRWAVYNKYQTRLETIVPMVKNQKGLHWLGQINAILCLATCPSSYPKAKEDFVYYLGTGEEMPSDDPVYLLREIMLKDKANKAMHMSQRQRAGLVIKAWNLHREEMSTNELRFRVTGTKTESFPSIK